MFRRIFDRNKLEVTVICCGDTGLEMGSRMVKTLKSYGSKVKSLVITSAIELDYKKAGFNQSVIIEEKKDGFAKKLDKALEAAEKKREIIDEKLQKVIPEDKDGLMLMITGAGATGLGSTLVLIDLLYENYRKVPPIVTLLPETFESSRVQYNISTFLYQVAFHPENKGNAVLLLDNKPSMNEGKLPFAKVAKSRLEKIPVAFADLLYASFEDSMSPEFDAKVQDLFEVMHTPGVSVFISEELGGDEPGELDSSRISDVIAESVISTTSLSTEQVFDAKNAYIVLFNIDKSDEKLSFQTEFEARKLHRSFRETHPFIKIIAPDTKQYGRKPKLRGIITGLPLPNRILQIMRLARNSRKRIMVKEHNMQNEIIPLDVEKVMRLEDKLNNQFSSD